MDTFDDFHGLFFLCFVQFVSSQFVLVSLLISNN